jgi:hypothetical protein
METGRGTGLKTDQFKTQCPKRFGKWSSTRASGTTARLCLLSDKNDPVQCRTGRYDNRLGGDITNGGGPDTCGVFTRRVCRYSHALILQQRQVWLVEDNGLHPAGIVRFVALHAVGSDGRTSTRVEHPVLQPGEIRVNRHFAAKGIQFEYKVGLCQPPYRRVARHATKMGQGLGDKKRTTAKP